jgi:hypothetical protein
MLADPKLQESEETAARGEAYIMRAMYGDIDERELGARDPFTPAIRRSA